MQSLLAIDFSAFELKDILIGLGIVFMVLILVKGMNTSPDMKNDNGNNNGGNKKNNNNNNNSNNSTGQ